MHSSLEESWNPDESEPPSPTKELLDKYNKRVEELEKLMTSDTKSKKFQLQLQLENLHKWYQIKEHLIEITKEANLIECEHIERRQELIIQIRRRERQLFELRKLQLKGIKKEKQMGNFIKEHRVTKRTDLTIQEIDELLSGIGAMKEMLAQKYGWSFPKKAQVDLSADEFLQDMEILKTERIKFDFLENNVYHLDASEQMQYEMEKFKKKHKNGLLDLSARSYQSLSSSSKKEMLSLRYDKVSTRLPQLQKEIVPQTQSLLSVQQLKNTIAISKILTRPIHSQHVASPKKKNQPFGFIEDIIANSVSSRILTRKQTTNLTHHSEGESQRKEKRITKVLEHTANSSSQERMLKLKNVQKIYYPDIQFDVIREAPIKKKQKIVKRGQYHPSQSIKKILQHVNQTFNDVIKNKNFTEHKFTKIQELQKQQIQDANTSLSKANRYQLEEKLDDVWKKRTKTFGLLQKKVQNMNQQQLTLSSHFSTDQAEEKLHAHKDKLLQKILEQVQVSFQNTQQTQDGESQFYDAFKYGIAHQQLSDMLSQVQMSSNIDQNRKIFSQQVLNKLSIVLKNYSIQQYRVQIRINQQLHYLIRDTIRTIQEAFEACQQVDKVQLCGKEAAFKQYDKYLRQLDQQSYFWEQLHTLENRTIILQKETMTSEISQYLDNWINTLFFRLDLKQPQQKVVQIKPQTQTQTSIQTSKISPQPDNRLRTAHELYAGLGRDKDEIAALQLYSKLAAENNPIALAIMGQIQLNGILNAKDYDQAFNYFKKSADQRNTFSLYHASKLVLEGKVFDKFLEKDDNTVISKQSSDAYIRNYDCTFAIALLKKAAELDHLSSMIYLGDLYSNGHTVQEYVLEKDYSNAEFYYKQAKNKNSVQAMHKLAMLYQTMCKQSIYKNRSQLILPLLNQAKNLDYLPAFYDLGILLYQGLQEEIKPNPVMADLIFEQGSLKGDLKCAQKLLSIRFQGLRKEEVPLDDFFNFLDQLEENNKEWTIIHYMRGKVYEKGIQTEKNIRKALEQYKIGAQKGCLKCKSQLEKHAKETITTEHNNPTNSQQSSLHQRQTVNGFIEQVRQSEWRKPFSKSRQVSIGNVQQIYNNAENDALSTIQDRYTRMTISITRPKNQTEDDRKRGASASDFQLQDIGKSILLSQIKSPEKIHQHSIFFSPRQPSTGSQANSQITNSTSKNKRFNLNQLRKISQQNNADQQQQQQQQQQNK